MDCTIYVAKIKDDDQLYGYRAADLCLCFCRSKYQVFYDATHWSGCTVNQVMFNGVLMILVHVFGI